CSTSSTASRASGRRLLRRRTSRGTCSHRPRSSHASKPSPSRLLLTAGRRRLTRAAPLHHAALGRRRPRLKDVWSLTTWSRTSSRKLLGFADFAGAGARTGVGQDEAITALSEAEQRARVRHDTLPASNDGRTRESSASSTH